MSEVITQYDSTGDFLNIAQREENEIAKKWWWISRGLQFITLAIGIVITIWSTLTIPVVLVAMVCSIASVITQWLSDSHKSTAQSIHRKFEFLDALGWQISTQELRNLHMSLPKSVRKKIDETPNPNYGYFASKEPRSPRRLLENLTETAFFSRHLAMRSAAYFFVATVVIFLIGLFILFIALFGSATQVVGIIASRVVLSIFAFLFTAGFVRFTYEYYRFAQIAGRIDEATCMMRKEPDIDLQQAIKLYHEYQIARASSPPIFTQVWTSMRNELNTKWAKYEQPQSSDIKKV